MFNLKLWILQYFISDKTIGDKKLLYRLHDCKVCKKQKCFNF